LTTHALRFAQGTKYGMTLARPTLLLAPVILTAYAVLSGDSKATYAALAAELVVVFFAMVSRLLAWRLLLAVIILLILFVPVKLYSLPATLPFSLEPYRLVVAFVALGWIGSLLVDSRVRPRGSGVVDKPLAAFVAVVLVGEIVNHARVNAVGGDVVKRLLFFASFFVVLYLIVSVANSRQDIDFLIKTLVIGGAVVGFFALIESRTGYNVFNHLSSFMPILRETGDTLDVSRGGQLRVVASSQHPIALGAAMVILIPPAVYLARVHRGRWLFALLLNLGGAVASVSRTPMLMLLTVVVTFLWLRPAEVKRLWPALLPLVLMVHFALPGTIGNLKSSFFPKGGLIQEQQVGQVGSGRVSTLGPALRLEFKPNPILGEGFGTRVTKPDDVVRTANAPILDDQWLGTLLETGLFGALAMAWIFVRFVRRVGREAKEDTSWRGWLLACIAASVTAYGVSMFTYDSFSFIQVTFLLFMLIGIGSAAYRLPRGSEDEALSNLTRGGLASVPSFS